MTVRYADRAFIKVSGLVVAEVQSATLKQNYNRKVVPCMTANGRNTGYIQGNVEIDVTVSIANTNQLSRPKFESLNYEKNAVSIVFLVGSTPSNPSTFYTATGVFLKDVDDAAGGVGDEVKTTFNFGALDVVDSGGASAALDLSTLQ